MFEIYINKTKITIKRSFLSIDLFDLHQNDAHFKFLDFNDFSRFTSNCSVIRCVQYFQNFEVKV